jgi:hypothetical protein
MEDREKIDSFLKWIKKQKESTKEKAVGGGSSYNWGIAETMEKVYRKANKLFKETK